MSSNAPPTPLVLKLEQHYPSPPEVVFEAWRDIDKVRRWFGCGPGQLWTVHTWDCRRGGRLHVSMDIQGRTIEVEGEFLVVDSPRRLEYRWTQSEVVEVHFSATERGTHLQLFHRGLAQQSDRAIRDGGWTYCLSSLGRFVGPTNPP